MKRKVLTVVLCMFSLVLLEGCGSEKKSEEVPAAVIEEQTVAVEETVEVETEVVEETVESAVETESVEETVENLSNEEWFKKLNSDTMVLVLFNDTTDERKILEDGQEYTVLETDELAIWYPFEWNGIASIDDMSLYNDIFLKYNCIVYDINFDAVAEKTEFMVNFYGKEDILASTTVYFSK